MFHHILRYKCIFFFTLFATGVALVLVCISGVFKFTSLVDTPASNAKLLLVSQRDGGNTAPRVWVEFPNNLLEKFFRHINGDVVVIEAPLQFAPPAYDMIIVYDSQDCVKIIANKALTEIILEKHGATVSPLILEFNKQLANDFEESLLAGCSD